MREITVTLYPFAELSPEIQERTISKYRNEIDYTEYEWELEEGFASIKAFCEHFGVEVKECHMSAFARAYIITDATNAHFRGIKLKSIDRELMPTGYYIDCNLWETFHDEFKLSGNALNAFECALESAILAVQRACEDYYEDESIIARFEANEHEFLECGEIYN